MRASWPDKPLHPSYASMMRVLSILAFFVCPFTSAQAGTTKFTNAWLSSYVVGLTYQITWAIGNDRPISLVISNSTWSQGLASFLPPQTTTAFNWTVPSSLDSTSAYALSLSQNGLENDMSPPFFIVVPSSLYATAQPDPASQNSTRTVHGTLTTLGINGTRTGAVGATSTYWDTACYCMKTAVVPMPTRATGSPNYTTPAITANSTPTPSWYLIGSQGGAARQALFLRRIGFEVGFALAMAAFILA